VGEGELESWLEELLDVWPPDVFLLLNLGDSEDLDIPESSSVSGSHVLVHGLDGLGSGKSSELLDHLQVSKNARTLGIVKETYVVGTGSGVVSEPDGEVLDLQWLLLVDLYISIDSPVLRQSTYDVQSDNLSGSLLDLLQLSEVVPESGLGDNIVGRKDPHSAIPSVSSVTPMLSRPTRAWGSGPPPWAAFARRQSIR
jgi:hypothetical protein